jgi:Xaa-Pro dipeptidase
VDVAVVTEPESIHYLTGFETLGYFTPIAAIISRTGSARISCRDSEVSNVVATSADSEPLGYGDEADPVTELLRALPKDGAIGWDLGISGWTLRDLQRLSGSLDREPIDIGTDVYAMRAVKSAVEIDLLRRAALATRAAMDAAIEAAQQADYEREVVAAAYRAMVLAEAAYPSSPVYAVSGPRSAQAHVTWDPERALSHDVLFLEIGANVRRYTAPLMSTGLGHEASERLRFLAERLEPWLEAVTAAVRPGIAAGEVDRVARANAAALGIDDAIRHRIGYSVGLSFPQGWGEPQVLALRSSEERELVPGMVFHLVPHLIDEDHGGVGSSSTVVVTERGCERITYTTGVFDY